MSHQLLGALTVFVAVTLFTPGPNNVMLMASGLNFGLRRTLPHAAGVVFGFGLMVLLVGLGLGAIFSVVPWLYTVLKIVAAAYLLYLAWKIATAGTIEEGGNVRPMTFLEACAFQWINPKAWIMSIGAVTTYAAVAVFPLNVVVMAAIFTVVGAPSALAWISFGTGVRKIVTDPKAVRFFNYGMAILLILSLIPVLFEH